ncbi:MAG: NAD(P)-dependent oxidoreductase [Acidaminococcaceae bacterium]|nr:NAD(P)-dependent oxidoreductase [Acidaminococcaceae bacterium]
MSEIMSMADALKEARRCLNCAKPGCRTGCPIENNIPQFIRALRDGNLGTAYEIISERSNLPAICGRVCPHEKQCESHCVLARNKNGIKVGSLERFIADFAHINGLKPIPPTTGERGSVAVIGSGPAGLTVAGDLAKMNFGVTVFEGMPEPGGVLMFGIPEFRLSKVVVRREIDQLRHIGVVFKTGVLVGPDITVDDMFAQGFDAIFMGTGTALPKTLDLPGKELAGIITATYYLQMVVLVENGKLDARETLLHDSDRILVIGAGNVAMDAARTAIRRGAKSVTVVYHKTDKQVSAFPNEFTAAQKEGVQFEFLQSPTAYTAAADGSVGGLDVEEMVQTPEGKFKPTGKHKVIPCDRIILAIGQKPAARIVSTTTGIRVDERGFVITRERPYGMTTRAGVFSSGDVVHGPATVVLAMRESKKVAAGIAQYVDAKHLLAECEE